MDYVKYRSECTMGSIAQGCGQEANIVRGKAKCLETTCGCNISCVVDEHKQYFNWSIATYTQHDFRWESMAYKYHQ